MKKRAQPLVDHPLWYRDAVIYELHVRSFCDSNGDGIGDFNGLISKLDYIRDLGVTAIWLLPFYPSPSRDDGYDIADYTDVNPKFGTLADFKNFLVAAHDRGLRVITELVLNHTSSEHPWFQRARRAQPGSKERAFYVWSDTVDRYRDARIIFQDFESSNWTWDTEAKAYYWHRFFSHQPDLNFDSLDVQQAMLQVLDFWMALGVDGLRLDAVPYLFEREGTNCENLPETHAFLKMLRAHIDARYPNRMLLAEANQWPEDAAAYFGDGDECHMNFHFPLMPRIFIALQQEDRFPILDILHQTPAIPDSCQWATFLRNHDELTLEMVTEEDRDYMWRAYAEDRRARINLGIRRRLAPLLRNRNKIEMLYALLFSLPGTPVLYYGDEIGMGDNIYIGDRDGVRTPMQWSSDRNAGFSCANPQRLYLPVITDPEYHYQAVNVETELANPSSLLWWLKRLIALHARHVAFGRGMFQELLPDNTCILAFTRSTADETLLVVANLSRFSQYASIDLSAFAGRVPEELFGRVSFPRITNRPYGLSLGPHAFYWFILVDTVAAHADIETIPQLAVDSIASLIAAGNHEDIERLLPAWMMRQRWFRSKTRRMRKATIADILSPVGDGVVLLVDVVFYDGVAEEYLVPLTVLTGKAAERVVREHLGAVFARLTGTPGALLCDATVDAAFASGLLALVADRRSLRGEQGVLVGRSYGQWPPQLTQAIPPHVSAAEQSNTSILFDELGILKLQRQVEVGINCDVELVRFLNERTTFANGPHLLGTLEYARDDGRVATVGMLQRFIPNRGDAWRYTLETLDRFCEEILTRIDRTVPVLPSGTLEERLHATPPEVLVATVGAYLPMIRQLGRRTAELHAMLASVGDDARFAPEPFTTLHQRSLFQSARGRLLTVCDNLRTSMGTLHAHDQTMANQLLTRTAAIEKSLHGITRRHFDVMRIRSHGDYHLGQVLFTGKDFMIIDFEGEPARPLSERSYKRCPLRDVAGMLRSFDYAAATALHSRKESASEVAALAAWLQVWRDWTVHAFLGAYHEAGAGVPAIPQRPDDITELLHFYLLDKCIYELGYELNNRPDWVSVPMGALLTVGTPTGIGGL